jgi:uncharacterized damage-inducible protein DinB
MEGAMIDYLRPVLTAQYEAALSMLRMCIAACPDDRWEEKIANGTFRWVAYHTLFFTDYYLASEAGFVMRDLNQIGGDEREDRPAPGLERAQALEYLTLCREHAHTSLARETDDSLRGESGFSWHKISRSELHVYNIRHIQHHAGQLSAHLRRVGVVASHSKDVRWVGSGWRE